MKPKIPTLDDVTRIVINRIAVWHLFDIGQPGGGSEEFWRKVKGGPGFDLTPRPSTMKTPDQMQALVAARFAKLQRIPVFKDQNLILFQEDPAYRYWKSGSTLNIVRKDLPHRIYLGNMSTLASGDDS